MLISIISFMFVMLICVLIHEFGHFAMARLFGVKVHEFSFGMGPLVRQWQGAKNRWSFRAFPVGGFVRLAGMGEEKDGETLEPDESFQDKAGWKKIVILAAGAVNNMLLALLIAVFLLMSRGVMDLSTAEVGALMPGFPAEQAGLRSGDVILAVEGNHVSDWRSMTDAIRACALQKEKLNLEVRRGNSRLTLVMGTQKEAPDQPPLIGIRPAVKKLPLSRALKGSAVLTWHMGKNMLEGIKSMILRPQSADVAGPVGIAAMAGQAAHEGFDSFMSFLLIISLNLGILNLIPFPALDGGHILVTLAEMLTRRKLSIELKGRICFIGLAFLMALMLLITGHDIIRIFR